MRPERVDEEITKRMARYLEEKYQLIAAVHNFLADRSQENIAQLKMVVDVVDHQFDADDFKVRR